MVALWCSSCSEQDDTKAIRNVIDAAARCAEDHDVGGVLDLALESVRADPGDLDRNGIKGILWRAFQYYGPIKILYPRPDIEVIEGARQAIAVVPFLVVKKEQSYPKLEQLKDDPLAWLDEVGANADLYRLQMKWTGENGKWLVRHVLLERFTGLGFRE